MRGVQSRIVNAIEALTRDHPEQIIALVFHADLIKLTLAHYLGMHLDVFQRIVISPASISTLHLGHSRPFIIGMNDIAHLQELKKARRAPDAATDTGRMTAPGIRETHSTGCGYNACRWRKPWEM